MPKGNQKISAERYQAPALWSADRPESESEPWVLGSEQSVSACLPGPQPQRHGEMKTGAERMDGARQASRVTGAAVSWILREEEERERKERARLASLGDSRAGSTGLHAFFENLGPCRPPRKA